MQVVINLLPSVKQVTATGKVTIGSLLLAIEQGQLKKGDVVRLSEETRDPLCGKRVEIGSVYVHDGAYTYTRIT